jgi:hypothetical protein
MKLRWHAHPIGNNIATLVYSQFVDPENEPLKIKFWGQVVYVPEIDAYGATYYSKDRIYKATDKAFDSIYEAMQAVEQQLFEEGIRDDAT